MTLIKYIDRIYSYLFKHEPIEIFHYWCFSLLWCRSKIGEFLCLNLFLILAYNKKYDFAGNVKPKILRREKCFQISGRKIEQMSISQTPICQKQMLGLFWKLIFVFWKCGLEVPCPEILIRRAENKQQQWLDWRAKMSVINPSQELKGRPKVGN